MQEPGNARDYPVTIVVHGGPPLPSPQPLPQTVSLVLLRGSYDTRDPNGVRYMYSMCYLLYYLSSPEKYFIITIIMVTRNPIFSSLWDKFGELVGFSYFLCVLNEATGSK